MAIIEKKSYLSGQRGKKKSMLYLKDGQTLSTKECIRYDFYINGDRFSDEFIVIEKLIDKVIIGAATLQKWRMKLDFEHDAIIYDPKVTKLRIV